MALYCGIDLHSTNHLVVVIDDKDRRVLEKRLANDVSITVDTLGPYRDRNIGGATKHPGYVRANCPKSRSVGLNEPGRRYDGWSVTPEMRPAG